ncbi:GATA transcription factor 7-like [Magnolia sinica]|uniref:GATA transcription factor 7-like n=1 Tax=Magnolia sinica TaxID=86752 RepID=UPI002658E502|nr:GATA transcription factor 7-like [Magnolia sinica]
MHILDNNILEDDRISEGIFGNQLDDCLKDFQIDVSDDSLKDFLLDIPGDSLDNFLWIPNGFEPSPNNDSFSFDVLPQSPNNNNASQLHGNGKTSENDDFAGALELFRYNRHLPRKSRSRRVGRVWSMKSPVPLGGGPEVLPVKKCCSHCQVEKTPQWRQGPRGPKTLCNACGVRYKSGRLVPEYRPAASPSFVSHMHSNSHKKIMMMRDKRREY